MASPFNIDYISLVVSSFFPSIVSLKRMARLFNISLAMKFTASGKYLPSLSHVLFPSGCSSFHPLRRLPWKNIMEIITIVQFLLHQIYGQAKRLDILFY